MDHQLILICSLTAVIHLIGTLAYATGVAGLTTKRIAIALSLFNIIILVSRTANGFLSPFLAKRIENSLLGKVEHNLLLDFRYILVSATMATIVGMLLLPAFYRLLCKAVVSFQHKRSVFSLLFKACSPRGLVQIKESLCTKTQFSLSAMLTQHGLPWSLLIANVLAVALWTVGVFSSLYAGCLYPELRVTASSLSAVINGGATIMLVVFIDPQMSSRLDDAMQGRLCVNQYRYAVAALILSRFVGTIVAQVFLVPGAQIIVDVAHRI